MTEPGASSVSARTKIAQFLAMTLARPYVAAELPGWGRLYGALVGDWRRNAEWEAQGPRLFRNKLNGCWCLADLSQWSDRSAWFLRRWYDIGLIRTLDALVDPGDVVVDVGANYGHFATAAACRVGPSGRVYAFEPNPRALARLRVNADLNRLAWIETRAAALGATPGRATLSAPRINSGEATLGRSAYDPSGVEEIEVAVLRGDDALAGVRPRFVKIDVEGFETEAVAGLAGVLRAARPLVVTEIVRRHLENAGTSPEALVAALDTLDYAPLRLGGRGRSGLALRPFKIADGDGDALWIPREQQAATAERLAARGVALETD